MSNFIGLFKANFCFFSNYKVSLNYFFLIIIICPLCWRLSLHILSLTNKAVQSRYSEFIQFFKTHIIITSGFISKTSHNIWSLNALKTIHLPWLSGFGLKCAIWWSISAIFLLSSWTWLKTTTNKNNSGDSISIPQRGRFWFVKHTTEVEFLTIFHVIHTYANNFPY